jgi:hypothetical protein
VYLLEKILIIIQGFMLSVFNKGYLARLQKKALRKNVLNSSLSHLERGILFLTSRIVGQVSNPILQGILEEIVWKLTEAMKSVFIRHREYFGVKRVIQIAAQAAFFGCELAYSWINDACFVSYVTIQNLNHPIDYKI